MHGPAHLRAALDRAVANRVVSPDDFRVDPGGEYVPPTDFEWEPVAWAREAWRQALRTHPTRAVLLVGAPGAGKTTWLEANRDPSALYYDATLTRSKTRRELVAEATRAGVPCEALVFDVPLAELDRRNAARPRARRVEPERLWTMCRELEEDPPTTREGFARVGAPTWGP